MPARSPRRLPFACSALLAAVACAAEAPGPGDAALEADAGLLDAGDTGAPIGRSDAQTRDAAGHGRDAGPRPPPDAGAIPPGGCGLLPRGAAYPVEGALFTLTLACASGANDTHRFTLTGAPPGARFEAASRTFTWTPPMDAAGMPPAVLRLGATGPAGTETATVSLEPVDALDAPGNVAPDPLRYQTEHGLPILWLRFDPTLDFAVDKPAELIYRGQTHAITAHYRGGVSRNYPKRSYTLEFPGTRPFEDPALGFSDREKLLLLTTFNDGSYLRHRVAFTSWREFAPGRLSPHTASGVAYLWDHAARRYRYHGLYTLADQVNRGFFRQRGVPQDGDLYKGASFEADFSLSTTGGAAKDPLWRGWEKKRGTPENGQPGAYDPIVALSRFITESDDASFEAQLGPLLELDEFIDWWCLIGYHLLWDNPSHNAYVYQATAGAPWRYVPWDPDGSFGQSPSTLRQGPDTIAEFREHNLLFRRLLSIPALERRAKARFRAHVEPGGALSAASLTAEIDRVDAEIRPAALRDADYWQQAFRSYVGWANVRELQNNWTSYDEEVAYMKRWVTERGVFLLDGYL